MSWIEMRGCLDTGTRGPRQVRMHFHVTFTTQTHAWLLVSVGWWARGFKREKILTPLPKGFLLLSCGCLRQCTRLVRGRSQAARDKDTTLYIKQTSRMPNVVSKRARREMTQKQGFGQVQLSQARKARVSGGRRAIAVAASQFLMQKARRARPRRFQFCRWACSCPFGVVFCLCVCGGESP